MKLPQANCTLKVIILSAPYTMMLHGDVTIMEHVITVTMDTKSRCVCAKKALPEEIAAKRGSIA